MSRGFVLLLSGAASGALALLCIGLLELIAPRSSPWSSPWHDLSFLAGTGAALGFLLGALRLLVKSLSPFGLTFGAAIGAWIFWARNAGRIEADQIFSVAIVALALVGGGALVGQLLGWFVRTRLDFEPKWARSVVTLVVASVPGILAIANDRTPPHRETNLLLLTIDTLRSDRLGFMGCPDGTSPALDRLARSGWTATRATTPVPRTLPAFASLMTGAFPHDHGVRDNFHYALGPAAETLAEDLAREGFSTGAVNSNPVLSHASGVYQGFLSANDRGHDSSRLALVCAAQRGLALWGMKRGDRTQVITDLALDWMSRRPRDKPFFLWVHWLAPHMPYEPILPFVQRFASGSAGPYAHRFDYGTISKGEMTYRNTLDPETLEHCKALYDGEVATADRAVHRLLRELAIRGELDDTSILFTADHGESLDEHGYFFNHGDFVYGPAANVPFVGVNLGGNPGEVRSMQLSIIDCKDLLLGEQEIDSAVRTSSFGESGFCRFPHLNDKLGYLLPQDISQDPTLIEDWSEHETNANRAKQRFVETERWKLVLSPHPHGDGIELFDLANDPGEKDDRSTLEPDVTRELLALLNEWIALGNAAEGTALHKSVSEADRARFRGLGYLGN